MISNTTAARVLNDVDNVEERLDAFEATALIPSAEMPGVFSEVEALRAALDDLYLLTLHLSEGRVTKADIAAFFARHSDIMSGVALQ